MKEKTLYLIPGPLGTNNEVVPAYVRERMHGLNSFVVEKLKTARRLLRSLGYTKDFDSETRFLELDKHNGNTERIFEFLLAEQEVGLLSEAGFPCIADPGTEVVQLAHDLKYKIVPLVGPSSILLALVASGLNGQNFTFNGYLPIDKRERKLKIREMEQQARKGRETQIFMDTPYRNDQLLKAICDNCRPDTILCIACDLTLESEEIIRLPISKWKKFGKSFHKRPAMFVLGF